MKFNEEKSQNILEIILNAILGTVQHVKAEQSLISPLQVRLLWKDY